MSLAVLAKTIWKEALSFDLGRSSICWASDVKVLLRCSGSCFAKNEASVSVRRMFKDSS